MYVVIKTDCLTNLVVSLVKFTSYEKATRFIFRSHNTENVNKDLEFKIINDNTVNIYKIYEGYIWKSKQLIYIYQIVEDPLIDKSCYNKIPLKHINEINMEGKKIILDSNESEEEDDDDENNE